jgi:hypothetical protein
VLDMTVCASAVHASTVFWLDVGGDDGDDGSDCVWRVRGWDAGLGLLALV